MWAAFLQFHILLQRIYTLRFIYNPTSSTFIVNRKPNPIYYWINLQILLVFFVSSGGILSFLTKSDPNLTFVYFIMDLMYWVLMITCLSSIWTHAKKRDETVWLLNQMMTFKKQEELQDKRISLGTIIMYTLGTVVFIFPVALSILPFVFKDTPANTILRFVLPHYIMQDKTTERILSSLYWLIQGFFAVIPLMQLIAILILTIFDSKSMLAPTYTSKITERRSSSLGFNIPHISSLKFLILKKGKKPADQKSLSPSPTPNKKLIQIKQKLQQTVRFHQAYRRYQAVTLVFASFNRFAIVLFPGLLLTSLLLIVVIAYVVIKLGDTLPGIMIGMMGTLGVGVTISTFAAYSFALVITSESERFREFWKGKTARLVYKKQLRTNRLIRVDVGSFFAMYRSIALRHMQLAVEQTVNFLLV